MSYKQAGISDLADCFPGDWIKTNVRTPFVRTCFYKRIHVSYPHKPTPEITMIEPASIIPESENRSAIKISTENVRLAHTHGSKD